MFMLNRILFYKLQASGNDFILIDGRGDNKVKTRPYSSFAQRYCQRKFGIGADGLLVVEPSATQDFTMRIFNANGSEAEMCGNGARCVALWASQYLMPRKRAIKTMSFATKAGVIEAVVGLVRHGSIEGKVRVKMSDPGDMKCSVPIKVCGRTIKVDYINTGVPHVAVMVDDVDQIAVDKLGGEIRFHKQFAPHGTNVNFVEIRDEGFIKVRTYERGVEAETLACGTGSVAAAIMSMARLGAMSIKGRKKVLVEVKSGEVITVLFYVDGTLIKDVWLEGKSYLVYQGYILK